MTTATTRILRECGEFEALTDNRAEQIELAKQYVATVRAERSQSQGHRDGGVSKADKTCASGTRQRIYRKYRRGQRGNTFPSLGN